MKVSVVGKEVTGRDLAQRVISLELSDNPFVSRSTVVEAPDVEGPQSEIGNQDLIVVTPELEQGQLLVQLFGLRSSNNYEAIRMNPANGLIIKFGCLHSCTHRDVFQVSQLAFDRSGESGDNDKAGFALLQPLDDPPDRIFLSPIKGYVDKAALEIDSFFWSRNWRLNSFVPIILKPYHCITDIHCVLLPNNIILYVLPLRTERPWTLRQHRRCCATD